MSGDASMVGWSRDERTAQEVREAERLAHQEWLRRVNDQVHALALLYRVPDDVQ